MFNETPWVLISWAGILIFILILGFYFLKNNQKSGSSLFTTVHKIVFLSQFILGLLRSLFGAFVMFNGELFRDNTTGISRIAGIVGICLNAPASPIGLAVKKRS